MLRSLYTAGWSMLAHGKSMDVISNNLANVSTNGYKKDMTVFQTFPDVLTRRINDNINKSDPTGKVGNMELGSDVGEIFTNFRQGQLQKTDSNLDLSIEQADGAFFTVEVPDENDQNKQYYTKDGAFKINAEGYLVTNDGQKLLGEGGPIKVNNEKFFVSENGEVSVDGVIIDKLMITQFENTRNLKKFGNNLISAEPDEEKKDFEGIVRQGFLEMSNVNTIREMVDMINILRAYEANQKIIQAVDSTLEKSVNEVGQAR
jgi:flagellar basal-body rod protein FlgG